MKYRITTIAMAASLAFGFGMAGNAVAAGAGRQLRDLTASQQTSAVQQAQFRDDRGRDRREWRDRRGGRDWRDRRDRRHYHRPPPPRSGIYFNFGPRYAPPARYVPPRRVHRLPVAHLRWCENRYRSYRASDNTFQPYNGPRRQCASPYI